MIAGIQVSSFRPVLTTEEQVRAAFRKMREMGCDTVQLQWIDFSIAPETIVEAMEAEGIRSVSTQDFYQTVRERKEYFIRLNQLCRSEWVCVSGIPESYLSPEGLKAYTGELTEFIHELEEYGLKLCFHPRASDFRPVGQKDPVEYLMEHLPESAALCLDLYHVGHAGLSMEETIEKYRGKIFMVHFKDFRKDGEEECLVPVGQGDTDWSGALRACAETKVPYGFVEQERWNRDPFVCLKESFDWLRKRLEEPRRKAERF